MTEAGPDQSPWWSDDPIATFQGDRLQRRPFAKQIAEVIARIGKTSTSSTVVAVTGPWGSGKTSTLKLAMAHMDLDTWHVEWLNPWALSGPDAVTHELFATINAALPDARATKNLRKALRSYGEYAAPVLALVPHVGSALVEWQKTARARNERNSSLDRQAAALREQFEELTDRILVVVDDIDRLQPEEVLALFKAVRVLGRLPNVHYVLAFDQDSLLQVLTQTGLAQGNEARALAFLEKLVTVRLDQPPTRTDQTDELLVDGIRHALASLKVTPTEDQATRLAVERETLFVPLLAEPRKVTRFVAQIHSYVPLVDANEVDLVDFLVLTFIRLGYPRLYAALAEDRDILAAPVERTAKLEAWKDPAHVQKLLGNTVASVPDRTSILLHEAVTRLFPNIGGADFVHLSRDQRRRVQRVSDPDYVNRYFALNSEADPLSDAVLASALQQWASPSVETNPDRANGSAVLAALSGEGAAAESAPRILRRLTARSDDVDAGQRGNIAAFLLTQGRALSRTLSTRDAAVALIANLTAAVPADASTPDLIGRFAALLDHSVDALETPDTEGAVNPTRWAFTALVSSLRQAQWNPARRTSRDTNFLDRIADMCIETAVRIVDYDLQRGDDAPLHGATVALRLLEDVTGSQSVERRLVAALNAGTSIDTVAARFVDIGTDLATGRDTMVGFDAEGFMARFSRTRVEAARDHLAHVAETGPADDEDISWISRRAAAARGLLVALRNPTHTGPAIAPLERLQSYGLTDLRTGFVPAGGDNLPDLHVGVAFHFGGPLGANTTNSHLSVEHQEAFLAASAQRSSISGWLERNKQAWRLNDVTQWVTTDSHPRLHSQVECFTEGAPPPAGGPTAKPIEAKMKYDIGTPRDADAPSLQLSVAVGFRVKDLNVDREPAGRRYNNDPVPAALTLAELHALVVALLGCRETARDLWAEFNNDPPPSTWETQIAVLSRPGMGRNVDLKPYRRVSEKNTSAYDITYSVTREAVMPNAWSQHPDDYSAASAAINEWAQLEGFRGLESDLGQIELRRAP